MAQAQEVGDTASGLFITDCSRLLPVLETVPFSSDHVASGPLFMS